MLYGFAIQPVRLHRLKTSQGMVNMTSMRTTLHNIGSPCMPAAINHWLAGLRIFTMYIHVFCSFATKDLAKSTTCCQMYDWTRCQGCNMMLPVPRMGWWRMMNPRSLFRLSEQVVRWMPWHCMSICELLYDFLAADSACLLGSVVPPEDCVQSCCGWLEWLDFHCGVSEQDCAAKRGYGIRCNASRWEDMLSPEACWVLWAKLDTEDQHEVMHGDAMMQPWDHSRT